MYVGRDTIAHEVDSSAYVCTSGKCVYTSLLNRRRKSMASTFSLPPYWFGTHSPDLRE